LADPPAHNPRRPAPKGAGTATLADLSTHRHVAHEWRPITGLEDPRALASPELRAFTQVWQRQRAWLQGQGALEAFQERLARRWSIETGVLERLYDLTRGATESLVRHGFVASLVAHGESTVDADELMDILGDHRGGLDMVMDLVTGTRPLGVGFIKELHALMTRHQTHAAGRTIDGRRTEIPLLRGAFKVRPNNPTRPDGQLHEYCPPEQVTAEMDRLLALLAEIPADLPEVRAAWLHHRFVQIHPFQDGNGRVTRALASFELIRGGLFPMIVERHDRDLRYIPALERADAGDLRPLVELTTHSMLRSLRDAINTPPATRIGEATLEAVRRKVRARRVDGLRQALTSRLRSLVQPVHERITSLADDLTRELGDTRVTVSLAENTPALLRTIAADNAYTPDLAAPYVSSTLTLERAQILDIAVVLHAVGKPSPGAAIATIAVALHPRDTTSEFHPIADWPRPEPLLLALDEDEPVQHTRLMAWLDASLAQTLAHWLDVP
jgi:hypothetical protein